MHTVFTSRPGQPLCLLSADNSSGSALLSDSCGQVCAVLGASTSSYDETREVAGFFVLQFAGQIARPAQHAIARQSDHLDSDSDAANFANSSFAKSECRQLTSTRQPASASLVHMLSLLSRS